MNCCQASHCKSPFVGPGWKHKTGEIVNSFEYLQIGGGSDWQPMQKMGISPHKSEICSSKQKKGEVRIGF